MEKKITNTEEANLYYKTVNELVDKYIKEHKIKPSELNKYFSKNMKSFLENSGLDGIENINRIIKDVLDHRTNMELDGVLTFESFKILNESIISIGNSSINHEKILADFYKTSIGHIDLLDDGMHIYRVNDFNEKVISIIFSDQELDIIYNNIENKILDENKKRVISISDIDGIDIDNSIRIWLGDIISDDKFRQSFKKKVSKDDVLLIIKKIVQSNQEMPFTFATNRLKYKGNYSGYNIWEIR